MKRRGRGPLCGLLLGCALGLVAEVACATGTPSRIDGKEARMANLTTYPIAFASPRRDSAVAVTTRAEGFRAFGRELGLPEAEAPQALLLVAGSVVVVTPLELVAWDALGVRSWSRARRRNSPVAAAGDRIWFETETHYLAAVDAGGKLVVEADPLPGIPNDEFFLRLLWPREKDFVAVVTEPDPKYDSEGPGPKPRPQILGRRTMYGERIGAWGEAFEGVEQLPPIFVPETERLLLATSGEAISIALGEPPVLEEPDEPDVEAGEAPLPPRPPPPEPLVRFALGFPEPVEWSADGAGVICVLGHVAGRKAMLAMDSFGKRVWEWADAQGGDPWVRHPPVRAAGGRVYALTSSGVLALDEGRPTFFYDVRREQLRRGSALFDPGKVEQKNDDTPRFATALGDGSLLLVAGDRIRHLDASGTLRFTHTLDDAPAAPPVVDGQGRVYVVTRKELVQLR